MAPPQLVAVEWDDAHGSTTMFSEQDMEHRPYRFISVGILIRSDAVGVSLAREIGDDGAYREHGFIPRAMVVQEWSLGPLKKRTGTRRWDHNKKTTSRDSRTDSSSPLTKNTD